MATATHACPLCGFVHEIAAAPASPWATTSSKTTYIIPSGANGMEYDLVHFKGGAAQQAVLSLTNPCHDLHFYRCVIDGGLWNGVSLNDRNTIYDVTFEECYWMASPKGRIGLEVTSRPSDPATGYHGVNLVNCTFEPQGMEAVSFDGQYGSHDCTIHGNVIQGAGLNPSQQYPNGLEINGPTGFTVTGNTIWQCRGSAFNMQRHVTDDCGWVVTGNVLDATKHAAGMPTQAADSQQVLGFNVYGGKFGGKFDGNTIISAAPGGSVAYLSGCHGMDWRGTSWRDANGRAGHAVPTQVNCSGNLL